MPNTDYVLSSLLLSLAPSGVRIGHRRISAGDEHALLKAELGEFTTAATRMRRQSGAARAVARELLQTLGFHHDVALPRRASGAPIWPSGVVGSMAHDETVAVAAVATTLRFEALGIDLEPAAPLPADIIGEITTPSERGRYSAAIVESRALFCIKEAVYKALHPIDEIEMEFQDVEVDLESKSARTKYGRRVEFTVAAAAKVVALAFVRGPDTRLPMAIT